jgi:hypothetical protein
MRKLLLTSSLLLCALAITAQGMKGFNFSRVETKIEKEYAAIEIEGRIVITPKSIILNGNAVFGKTVFVINKKISEAVNSVVYDVISVNNPDVGILIEVTDNRIIIVDYAGQNGMMFLTDKVGRAPLPSKGVWYQKIKDIEL